MNRLFRYLTAASLAASASAAFAQAPPALDVKLGLWEITSTVDMGNAMAAMMDTSKMSPEQKARMEEAMKKMAGPHTATNKSCVTKEQMSKGFFDRQEAGENCTNTLVTNTASVLELKRECTGDRTETTIGHFEAAGPELMKGNVKSTIVKNGQTQNVSMTMTGKWLGADCGDVK